MKTNERTPAPTSNGSMAIGLIGAGSRIRHVYHELANATEGKLRIAACYDPDPAIVGKIRALPGGETAQVVGEPDQVIRHPEVKAVMIGSPNVFHTEPAELAMQAGLPLYLEKPLATTVADHRRLLDTYRRTGARVTVGFVLRYAPFYRKLKELMPALGDILHLQASEHMGIDLTAYTYLRGWRAQRRIAGPLLLEKCCHDIDIINWLLDRPCEWVTATGSRTVFVPRADRPDRCRVCPDADCVYRHQGTRPYTDVSGETLYGADDAMQDACVYNCAKDIDDHTTLLAEYAGGVQVSFNVTMGVARGERRIRIVGTRGMLAGCAEDNRIEYTPLRRDAQPRFISPESTGTGGHFGGDARLAADFVRLMRDPNAVALPSIPEGYRSGIICLAADASAATGVRIAIDDFVKGIP